MAGDVDGSRKSERDGGIVNEHENLGHETKRFPVGIHEVWPAYDDCVFRNWNPERRPQALSVGSVWRRTL